MLNYVSERKIVGLSFIVLFLFFLIYLTFWLKFIWIKGANLSDSESKQKYKLSPCKSVYIQKIISDKAKEVRGAGQEDDVFRPDGPRVRHQRNERQAGAAVQRSGQ